MSVKNILIPKKAKVQKEILKILKQGDEWTTQKLTRHSKHSQSSCYNASRNLERKGLVKSVKRKGGLVYIDPITGYVQTHKNFEIIKKARQDAKTNMRREIERKLKSNRGIRIRDIQNRLKKLLRNGKIPVSKKGTFSYKKIRESLLQELIDHSAPEWWLNEKLLRAISLILSFLISKKIINPTNQNQELEKMLREVIGLIPIPYYIRYWKLIGN